MLSQLSRRIVLATIPVLLVAAAASAQGQEPQMTDPRGTARIHVGPLYATPGLQVQEFGIDTNVFNNAEEKSDFTFTVVPRATVWVPFARRALVTTNVGSDVVYFQKYDSERSINPQVKLRAEGALGRILPFAEGSYLNTRQRPNFEIDARLRRTEQGARLGTSVRLSEKLYVEVAGSQQDVRFAADAIYNDTSMRETLNRTTRSAQFAVRHDVTPLTTVVVRGETASDRFQFSPLRNASSLRIMPGIEFKPRALVSGSAYVGMRRLSPDSDVIPVFNGVVTSATLSYTLKGSTRFVVTADRDLTYSYERVQPYYVAGGYGLTVQRQIVGRTDITGSVLRQSYSYRNLVDPAATVTALANRRDLTRTWSATLGYRFGQATRLGFGAYYRQRESNGPGFRDYQGFRFITTLDYGL